MSEDLYDLPLEEVITRGVTDARKLLETDQPFLAGYTLFLVRDRCRYAKQEVPKIVTDLGQQIIDTVVEKYPAQIRRSIEHQDFVTASAEFTMLALNYSKLREKIPVQFLELRNEIINGLDEGVNKEDFKEVYSDSRFEG